MARRQAEPVPNDPDVNSTSTYPKTGSLGWRALDHLPQPIRRALHDAPIDWCANWIRRELKAKRRYYSEAEAVRKIVYLIEMNNAAEISDFAHRWPSRFGKYPHVAAEATIQPYGRSR